MKRPFRFGLGTDIHRLVEGRRLRLGTVEIPHTHGLLGHSDGDVLSHAVADALLGAAGLGEIGSLFPNTDPQWAGMAGSALLQRVAGLLRENGWVVVNIDSVVQVEQPQLASHRAEMVEGIAGALGIETSCVSVKVKSAERLGVIGRCEAIAAMAVAVVGPAGGRSGSNR